MRKSLKNNHGFSLTELLTVVAIIGILSMIGIPRYQSFRVKAYQAEARGILSSLHSGETAFFLEYGGYHSSLKVLGVSPLGKARYNIGFGASGSVPVMAPIEPVYLNTRTVCAGTYGLGAGIECQMNAPVPVVPISATVSQTSYSALAVAYDNTLLSESQNPDSVSIVAKLIMGEDSNAVGLPPPASIPTGTVLDGWGMNELKVMTHASVDETTIDCFALHTCEHILPMPPEPAN